MFFITIAVLGLYLANNLHNAPRLYSLDTKPQIIAGDTGYKHAHYELHRRVHRDLALNQPRYWHKSSTWKNMVDEANGPSSRRTPFNLEVSKQGNLGQFPPVVGDRGKHL